MQAFRRARMAFSAAVSRCLRRDGRNLDIPGALFGFWWVRYLRSSSIVISSPIFLNTCIGVGNACASHTTSWFDLIFSSRFGRSSGDSFSPLCFC